MSESNLSDAGVYTAHLSEVNKTNTVKAAENIYNANGVLLVANGHAITGKIAEKVAQHKLRKPVEHSIDVSHVISAQTLYRRIMEQVNSRSDLSQFHQYNELDRALHAACEYYSRYKILVQKITVLSSQLEKLFERALGGAWLALAIAKQMKDDDIDPSEAFLVALIRDIGYLHLPKDALEDKKSYSRDERNAIRSHPLVAKLILDELEIPNRMKKAVVEHHERCDGAGFPKGKMAEQLSVFGQVIAMADEIQYLCMRQSHPQPIGNLIPFLSLNMTTHFKQNYNALIQLLRKADLQHQRYVDDKDMPSFISHLLESSNTYKRLNEILLQLLTNFNHSAEVFEIKLIINFANRIQRMLLESGLLSDEYARWISYVSESKIESAFIEMESVNLMHKELHKQFKHITGTLELLQTEDKEVAKKTNNYFNEMQVILKKQESNAFQCSVA